MNQRIIRNCSLLICLMPIVLACESTGQHVTDWGEITLAPGDTGSCTSNPCRVFLQMPKGTGSYEVTGNEVKLGSFPAGKTVSIGSFFESHTIKFPGTEIPPAYIYIPNVR